MKILGFEISKIKEPEKPKVPTFIAAVVFTELDGKITYEFKNGKNEQLNFTDVNSRFLFPLIATIERFFWVDAENYLKLSDEEVSVWALSGVHQMKNGNPKAFWDAYQEIVEKKKIGREFG